MDATARAELQEWLVRLADGDRSAFAPLFARAEPLLRNLASRMLGPGGDAEDAAQQALLRVFSRVGELDPERDGLGWMLAIVGNECRTVRKKRRRRREVFEGAEVPGSGDPEAELASSELARAAREVLGSLRPEDADALRAGIGELPRPAVPPATFRKRLQRATQRLRLAWRLKHGD